MSEFLAEAQVRILPDTTGFRAALIAEVQAATAAAAKSAVIPISAVAAPNLAAQTTAIGKQAQATTQLASQQAAAAGGTQTLAAATAKLTDEQRLQAAAARKLSVAQEEVLNVADAVGAAQVTASKSAAALTAARRAEAAITRQTDAETAHAIVNTLALAEAQNTEAQSALRAAKAQEVHAASMAQTSRGIGATGLSLLGVRGATLAAGSAFLIGAAAATTFAKSIQLATSFSSELNVFRVTAGATADEMGRVSNAARALGRDVTLPGVSAQDAAEAMTELSKAGLSVEDSIAGARGVLQLATAAQLSNADATKLAASALNTFGLNGADAVHVADLLANASNEAQGGIQDIGLALQQAGGVARQVGLSLGDTVAILTLLARNGLQGSDAGTALRTSLIRLINPTKEARNILKDLNIQLRDQEGNIRPEVFADFARATQGLTKAQQDARAAIVFGQDAIRAEAILGREGAAGLERMQKALEKQGTAAEIAGARLTGLAGQSASLQNNLESLGLTIGRITVPVLGSLVHGLNLVFEGVGGAAGFIQNLSDSLGGGNFDSANASLAELAAHLAELRKQKEDFASSGAGSVPPAFQADIEETTKRIVALGKAALATGTNTGLQLFIRSFTQSSPEIKAALEDDVITPLERTELATTALGRAFLKVAPKRFFTGLGAAARSEIEDAGAAVKRASPELAGATASAVEDASRAAVLAARQGGEEIGTALGDSMVESARKAIRASQGQLAGLQEEMNKLLAAGASPQQQIANLRRQAAKEEKIIQAAGPAAVGDRLKARRAAQAALAQINGQIASLEEQIKADQEQAARDAQDRRDKTQQARDNADRAFIDSISGRLGDIDNRILAAESRGALAKQLQGEKVKRDVLKEMIAQTRTTVKDAARRRDELRALTKDLIETNGEIRTLTKEIRDAERERIKTQEQAAEDARNAITEKLAKQTQLAELRGNDQAQLVAINRQIADARKRVAAAKKAKKGILDEQIALQQLINQRKELIKKIRGDSGSGSDATGGTTLADLFREQQRISNQASTVGRRPQDLTTSAANAGIRGLVEQRLTLKDERQSSAERAAEKQAAATDRLINSLDLLRETIVSGGNRSTAVARRGTGFGEAVNEHLRYVHATTARKLVEEST